MTDTRNPTDWTGRSGESPAVNVHRLAVCCVAAVTWAATGSAPLAPVIEGSGVDPARAPARQ